MSTKKPVLPTLKNGAGNPIAGINALGTDGVFIHVDTSGLTGDDVEVKASFNILTTTQWIATQIWTAGTSVLKYEVGHGNFARHVGKDATIFYSILNDKSDQLHVPIVSTPVEPKK